tara:strand:- start:205 stop:504 length:300 start_codon:yes stop_codon:yes gene_type:complete
MDFKVDKGLPIPPKWNGPNIVRENTFQKLLAEMDEGDSVLFPYNKDAKGKPIVYEGPQHLSKSAISFQSFLKKNNCKSTGRSLKEGKRIWLLEKGEPNE